LLYQLLTLTFPSSSN